MADHAATGKDQEISAWGSSQTAFLPGNGLFW